MSQEDKEKILRKVYYNEDGFGSINETYKEAKKQLNTITIEDTKTWLEKQKGRQTKAYKGFNSYVADEPLEEIQIDLADFTRSASENDGYRYCLVAVDVFTKMLWGVPIKNKKPEECIRAFKEVLDKIGKPKQIYHDNEGSFSSTEFIRLVNTHNIKQITVSTPPPFAERAIQTIKNMIHTRIEGLDLSVEKWVEMLPVILRKYNNTKHSTTNMTPNEATQTDNKLKVWLNIKNKAEFNRKYKPIKVGDKVRTYMKPKSMKKGYDSSWSKDVYTITFIKDNQYLINDHRRRVWNRWELLKIEAAEDKDS